MFFNIERVDTKEEIVQLSCRFPNGSKAFYVVKTTPYKAGLLREKTLSHEAFNIEEYGEILHKGWGSLPKNVMEEVAGG